MKSGAFSVHLYIPNTSIKIILAVLFSFNFSFSSPLAKLTYDPVFSAQYTKRFFEWYNDHIFSFSKYIPEKDFQLVKKYLTQNYAFYQTLPSGAKFQSFRLGVAKKERALSHLLTLINFKNMADLEALLAAKQKDFPTDACDRQQYGIEFFLTERLVEKNLVRICENRQGDFIELYRFMPNKKFKRLAKVQLNIPMPKNFSSKIVSNFSQIDEILLTKTTQYFLHNSALINERFMDVNDKGIINAVRAEFNLDPRVIYYSGPTKFILYYP